MNSEHLKQLEVIIIIFSWERVHNSRWSKLITWKKLLLAKVTQTWWNKRKNSQVSTRESSTTGKRNEKKNMFTFHLWRNWKFHNVHKSKRAEKWFEKFSTFHIWSFSFLAKYRLVWAAFLKTILWRSLPRESKSLCKSNLKLWSSINKLTRERERENMKVS